MVLKWFATSSGCRWCGQFVQACLHATNLSVREMGETVRRSKATMLCLPRFVTSSSYNREELLMARGFLMPQLVQKSSTHTTRARDTWCLHRKWGGDVKSAVTVISCNPTSFSFAKEIRSVPARRHLFDPE